MGMPRQNLVLEPLTRSVIGAFYEVYNTLGFGFLEHVYKAALERELLARGHRVEREVSFVIRYKGAQVAVQRLDMIVDEKLVVESKATIALHAGAQRQVYSYLRASQSRGWIAPALRPRAGVPSRRGLALAADLDPNGRF